MKKRGLAVNVLARKEISNPAEEVCIMEKSSNAFELAQYFGQQVEVKTRVGLFNGFVIKSCEGLNAYVRGEIINEFFPMTVAAFRQRFNNEWFRSAVEQRMFNSDVLILVFDEKQQGVGVWVFDEIEIKYDVYNKWGIYVAMISIRQEYQCIGMHKGLLDVSHHHTVRGHFDFTICRTQNPIVATAWWNKYGNVYPLANEPDEDIKVVGRITAKRVGFDHAYESNHMIARGVYNGESLHGEPFHVDNCLDGKLFNLIDYRKGDAVVLVSRA